MRAYDRAHFAARWPHARALLEDAARSGAKLVVLPEGSVPGYVLGDEPVSENELATAGHDIARIAREHACTIVYGGAKIVDGKTFNAAIVVGPTGEELGFAAKQFLWHFDRRWFAAGATLDPIDTPIGRLGLLVCADGRIPTIAATLVDLGAQLLVMPTAWVTSGRDPLALENIQADLMANVRARENGVPFIVANKCGVELQSVAYCGKSAIIDAGGDFIARAGERDEETIAGTVTTRERGLESARLWHFSTSIAAEHDVPIRSRARIAFAFTGPDIANLVQRAAQADADAFVLFGKMPEAYGSSTGDRATFYGCSTALIRLSYEADYEPNAVDVRVAFDDAAAPEGTHEKAGLRYAKVGRTTLRDPRGLVHARLNRGVDLFICRTNGDPDWSVRLARTRAAELRAFVVCFDLERERAFAVDPDGVVVAGTFGEFRLAAFLYDSTRTAATMVAPRTDVLEGLRIAESVRAKRTTSLA
jgi:predicted amidohydrolase